MCLYPSLALQCRTAQSLSEKWPSRLKLPLLTLRSGSWAYQLVLAHQFSMHHERSMRTCSFSVIYLKIAVCSLMVAVEALCITNKDLLTQKNEAKRISNKTHFSYHISRFWTFFFLKVCDFLSKGATQVWDDSQEVPYAYHDNQWVGYDDGHSFFLKVSTVPWTYWGSILEWKESKWSCPLC